MRKHTHLNPALLLFLFLFCLSLLMIACVSATATPAQPTRSAPVTPLVNPATLETTTEQIPAQSRLGQLFIQYPVYLQPGASKVINFQISLPAELADTSSDSYKPDVRPADSPRPLGKYSDYTTLILVNQRMRVELIAPNFTIQELYPTEQPLDLTTPNARTKWGWTITAPNLPNEYVLVVKVYMLGTEAPIWVGSFDVVVAAPTPTPVQTATPAPPPLSTSALILKNLADNMVTLIGTTLTTLVALLGLYLQYRKRKTTKK
jgi:hypothetical protein